MQTRWRLCAFLIAIGAVSLVHVSANAAIIYSISPVTVSAQPGDSGDLFDVLLTNSGPAPVSVAGFSFEVTAADPDITLTGADYSPVAAPYIFAGNSYFQENGIPLNFVNADGGSPQILDAGDVAADSIGTTLAAGESVGLGQVLFDVDNSAQPGPFAVSFSGEVSGIADANNLSTPEGDTISVDSFSGGTISVSGVPSVPEPASLMLALFAAPLVGLLKRKNPRPGV